MAQIVNDLDLLLISEESLVVDPVGVANFIWVKYADDANGGGMSDNPAGKAYLGLAQNKPTATPSTNPADYTWTLVKGTDGKSAFIATVYVQQSTQPSSPAGGSYNFSNNTLTPPAGWSASRPNSSTTPTWAVTFTFIATAVGATVTGGTWSTAVNVGQNGADGDGATVDAGTLKDILEGQLTEDQLYTTLRSRIALVDGSASTPGSVAAQVKAETDARVAAIAQEVTDRTTYVQSWSYSKQASDQAQATFGTTIQAAYQGYADNAANNALTSAKAYAQSYSYSKADSDSAISASANELRSEFQSLNQGTGATVAWVQNYAYSKAQSDSAIASSTSSLTTSYQAGDNTTLASAQSYVQSYAYSKSAADSAIATSTNQVTARLNSISGSGVTVEQQFTAQANATTGLQAQYTVKIDSNGSVAGFGLASTPINGVPTSSFIVSADKFAVALPGQTAKFPFVIGTVAGQTVIGLRGDVVLDGTFTFRDASGKPLLGVGVPLDPSLAAPGTNNSDLAPSISSAAGVSLIARGSVYINGNIAVKNVGVSNAWDSDVYSKDGYVGGAIAQAVIVANGYGIMFGLNRDPISDGDWTSLDYAIFIDGGGNLQSAESGTLAAIGVYVAGDVLAVSYDGSNIRYLRNGSALKTVAVSIAEPLFFDSSFATPGGSLSNIKFGPMSNISAGVNAAAALPGINTAIQAKLNKAANDTITGSISLQSQYALLVGDANNGVWVGSGGIFMVQGSVVKASMPISGNPTFAGQLLAAFGTFGAVAIAAGGSLGIQATNFNSDPGIWMGFIGGSPKFSIVDTSGAKLVYDPTAAQPLQIVNASMSAPVVSNQVITDSYSAVISGGAGGSGPNGSRSYGTLTANPSGGRAPYAYSWSMSDYGSSGQIVGKMTMTDPTQTSVSFGGSGTNATLDYRVTCVVTDANGRTVTLNTRVTANHGTPP